MRFPLIIIITFLTGLSFSQEGNKGPGRGKAESNGEIWGNVMDSISNEAIGYAAVKVFKVPSGGLAGGSLTEENGNFSVQNLPNGIYEVHISFAAYNTRIITGVELSESNTSFQLKDVTISPATLGVVDVIGGSPEITYEIDKKVVNVEDMQNTAGQTALEVLENVPSIIVSADGTVTLRGSSSFTLLIDGVPTVLDPSDALKQIPASTIQDIEIITNPSAKFDAEGTSGVINIITKKKKLQGTSMLANGTGGLWGNYASDAAFSVRREKFAFDLNANYNRRSRPEDRIEERTTIYDSLTNQFNGVGTSDRIFSGYGAGIGLQYTPNTAHTLVIKTDYNKRKMYFPELMNFENYNDGVLTEAFFTNDFMLVDMWSNSNSLFYQYNIKRNRNHYISAKAIANLRYVDQKDSTLSYDSEDDLIAGNAYSELGPSNMYRFNLDYALPIKENFKFETGVQAQFGRSFDDGDNYQYSDSTGKYEYLPLYSSDVNYIRDVHAGYAIFGGQIKQIGFQVGMRMEYTYRKVTSVNFPQFTTINRPDFFPSAHFSYSFKNKSQLLLSYSRRIERPRSWFFEPFITWESPYELRTGNPDLNPTYISVLDFSFMKPLKNKGFWSLESYFRQSTGTLKWIQTVYAPNVLIKRPYNIGTARRIGVEGSVNYSFTNWYQINAGFNAYYYEIFGEIEGNSFGSNSFNYNFNLRNTFNFKEWIFQVNGRIKSGSVDAQGKELWSFVGDVSLKKSFYKNKLSFILNARNAFVTDRNVSYLYTDNVSLIESEYPKGPMLSLTISLKLNNYEKFYNIEQLDDF